MNLREIIDEQIAIESQTYSYGTVQLCITGPCAVAIQKLRDTIDDDDLDGPGKDIDQSHVTIRYGIQDSDIEDIESYFSKLDSFSLTLGKTTSFPPSLYSDGASVLILPVTCPELHQMHKDVASLGNFAKSNFSSYKPHVTVAYLKTSAVGKYLGLSSLEGTEYQVTTVQIVDKDGKETDVALDSNIEAGGPGSGRHPYGKEDVSSSSAAKVKQLITTGGPSNKGLSFSDDEKAELQKTVLKDKQTLYRGIGVLESRIPSAYRAQVNALKVGDSLPDFLKKGAAYDSFASYTKKKSVANSYAEGKVSIVVSAEVPKSSTLVDLEHYDKLGDNGVASLKDDHDYLKSEKEVLVDEQHVTPKIVSIKGTLNVPR